MRMIFALLAALLTANALAVPNGYFNAGTTNEGKTKWFMHYEVFIHRAKTNPTGLTVLADVWMDDSNGRSVGNKQAFNCTDPGASFSVILIGDGEVSLSEPTAFPKGSVGYGLWEFACDLYPSERISQPAKSSNQSL